MNYLAMQNTYDDVQIALMTGETPIASSTISKLDASKTVISKLNELLKLAQLKLSDFSCIVVNCGPGPFTTLRVVIATVNGIAYAAHIPLIGINALEAAAQEWSDKTYETTAILFNAFGNDVYTLVTQKEHTLLYGAYAIDALLTQLQELPEQIRFLGNGTVLHKERIIKTLGKKAYVPETIPLYPTIKTIAQQGYAQWNREKSTIFSLTPVYLKQHPAAR